MREGTASSLAQRDPLPSDEHVVDDVAGEVVGEVAPVRSAEQDQVGVVPGPEPTLSVSAAENVGRAITVVKPYAVDVNSGVEARPGAKDAAKLRRFVAAARSAAGESA